MVSLAGIIPATAEEVFAPGLCVLPIKDGTISAILVLERLAQYNGAITPTLRSLR